MIEKAMRECHVALKPNKSAKQQALETLAKLKEHLAIERAQMRLRLLVPVGHGKAVKAQLKRLDVGQPEKEEKVEEDCLSIQLLVDPGKYRALDDLIRRETKGSGKLELVDLKEVSVEAEQELGV